MSVLIKHFTEGIHNIGSQDFHDIKLAKLLLSIVVIVFDILLYYQHYYVYSLEKRIKENVTERLMGSDFSQNNNKI